MDSLSIADVIVHPDDVALRGIELAGLPLGKTAAWAAWRGTS